MTTVIYYENSYSKPITEQQLSQLTQYKKAIEINGVLKFKEHYFNSSLYYITYYKDQGESDANAINSVLSQYSDVEFEIFEKAVSGTYVIETIKEYDQIGVYTQSETKTLYDSQGRVICEQETDDSEVEVIKWYYSYMGRPVICMYNPDDNTISTVDLREGESDYIPIVDFLFGYMPDFLNNNPYYADATFMPS